MHGIVNIKFLFKQELEAAFAQEQLHPADLKASVERYLNGLLEPVRKTFESPELKKLVATAYPPPVKVKPGQQAQVCYTDLHFILMLAPNSVLF